MDMFILLTSTEDWYSFGDDVEAYIAHIDNPHQYVLHYYLPEEQNLFRENVRIWSELFGTSYMNFRGKIKDITFRNHARSGLPIKDKSFHSEMSRDQIAFITDDDDWFNPAIVSEVQKVFEEQPEIEVVYWDCWQYHTSWSKEKFCIYNESKGVGSNSFAVRGGNSCWLYTSGAHKKVEDWIPDEKKVFIPYKALSIWNIHAASLWHRTNFLLYPNFVDLEKVSRPYILDWAKDETESMYRLVRSLRRKSWKVF